MEPVKSASIQQEEYKSAGHKACGEGNLSAPDGFTLVEVLIAAFVLVVGLLGTAMLLGVSLQSTIVSDSITDATTFGRAKLEDLERNPQVEANPGGSLTSNTPGYFDMTAGYTRRWLVAAPTPSTRDITVHVIPIRTTHLNKIVEMRTTVRTKK